MTRLLLVAPTRPRIGGTRIGSRMPPRLRGLGWMGSSPLIASTYPECNLVSRDAELVHYCERDARARAKAAAEEAPGTDTETPTPEPSPTTPTYLTKSDYESGTAAIKALAESMNACDIGYDSPLPAALPVYSGSDTAVDAAYDIYAAERQGWESVQETARARCAAEGSGPPIIQESGPVNSSPYNSSGANQVEIVEEYEPIELPPDTGWSTGAKAGMGIGGLVVVGGLIWLILAKRKGRKGRG